MESTSANQTSSRSHALLEVIVKQQNRIRNTLAEVQAGKLYMIDLAGSERASHTQNRGKRLVEGAHINRSLLALGNCINALADKGSKYVNYRDSKLTRLLKDALSGNCRTVMIAHIGPASSQFDESRNTLVYADRAKNIRNKVRRNVVDVTYHVAQYQTIIDELRHEITRLKTKANNPMDHGSQGQLKGDGQKENPEQVKQLKDDLVKTFNEQMELRRQLMDIDAHVLGLSIEFEKQSLVVGEWEAERINGNATSTRDDKRVDMDIEPAHVRQAWDDLMFIQDEQQRYWDIRKDVERQFRDCQIRASKIEEELPYRIGGNDQKELLLLLCKVHELEIEKMEMQAETLLKEHELLRKDMMILRYGRQRNLSNEIIQRQKIIIDGNQLTCPPELQELYNQYKAEMEEISYREKVGSAMPKSLLPGLDKTSFPGAANRRRSIVKKLPLLTEENDRLFVRRTNVPETGSGPKARFTPTSRSSATAPNPTIPVSPPSLLPPIETRGRAYTSGEVLGSTLKDGLKGINAVAARRRSVRTADLKNVETWTKTGKSRGSSVLNEEVTSTFHGYGGGLGNPVLHRRRNPTQFLSDVNGRSIPLYSMDAGSEYPRRVVYYPPNHTPPGYRETRMDGGETETIVDGLSRLAAEDPTSPESPTQRLSLTVASLPASAPESNVLGGHHRSGTATPNSPISLSPVDRSHHLQTVAETST